MTDPRLANQLRDLEWQHRQLIELARRYTACVRTHARPAEMRHLLADILDLAQAHFLCEERLLVRLRPRRKHCMKKHQAQHLLIVNDLLSVLESPDYAKTKYRHERDHAIDSLIVHHYRESTEDISNLIRCFDR